MFFLSLAFFVSAFSENHTFLLLSSRSF
jgi:hypothetical protein